MLIALLVALGTTPACGYRLAGQSLALPEGVEAIGIPTFTNRTNRPDLEQRITEHVIVSLPGAPLVVTGLRQAHAPVRPESDAPG